MSLQQNEIFNTLKKIISENIESPTVLNEIELESDLKSSGINSISFIKIVVLIENTFEIEFGDDALNLNKFPTLKSLISYIENAINLAKIK